ncbi:MAG TPA: hypothetical protein VK886_15055 [Vicinamibacterales bacterium]|nr:hypothetical protein [Vicinamibacterales bacterium]
MGAENRIQQLNRELRELASNARRERQEFEEFAFYSRRRHGRPQPSTAHDRSIGRSQEG